MPSASEWKVPASVQPKPEDYGYDLDAALSAVVGIRAIIPGDAFTAETLGTERAGNGVLIRADGLVLTIGYLVTEAETIWLTLIDGRAVPGTVLAYDQATGFGLIQALGKLDAPHLNLGSTREVNVGDSVFVIGHGGIDHALKTRLIGKREFAGYWEYVLDEALFTAPAHPQWGGAALLDAQGDVIGVGSLLVQQEVNGESIHVNMFVPVDLLTPILEPMLQTGRSPHPPRPWLGMYTQDPDGKLTVGNVSPGGPAERAGVQAGDLVLGVGAERVHGLAELFRAIWQRGAAGVDVPLTLARAGDVLRITVKSADRNDFLKKPNLH